MIWIEMKLTQFFASLSSDYFFEKKKNKKTKTKKNAMTNDLASVHTRAGRFDPKIHFLKSLFQVFWFELDEKKFTEVSLIMENTSRPENVSRSVFLLKLSVTSGLLNLPQAACKTCNIWKNY